MLVLFLQLIELAILFLFITLSVASMIKGAVFLPSSMKNVTTMMQMANIKPGMITADLGSGDGRIVIEMAKLGATAHGYEINPFLIWWSRRQIKKRNLQERAYVHWKSFWSINYADVDVITVYGITYIMKDLEKKLFSEIKPNAIIISLGFPFPTHKFTAVNNALYLYKKQ